MDSNGGVMVTVDLIKEHLGELAFQLLLKDAELAELRRQLEVAKP